MKNYYEELGVSPKATVEDIKQAYLALLKKYHPDIYSGEKEIAESQTQKLNNIYSTLKDEELRKQYDIEIGLMQESIVEEQKPQPKSTRSKADYDGGIFSGLKRRCASGFSYDYSIKQEKISSEKTINNQSENKPQKENIQIKKLVSKSEKTPEQKRLTKYTLIISGTVLVLLLLLIII